MCYVIYTGAGREKKATELIRKLVPRHLYGRVFYPFRHMRKKIGGEWADIYEWLIPGYVFITTERIGDLYLALRRVPRLTRLLGDVTRETGSGNPEFIPLPADEENWLRSLIGDKWFTSASAFGPADGGTAGGDGGDNDNDNGSRDAGVDRGDAAVVGLSVVDFDENDRVRILSGPLMTLCALVRRIDLHRRFAEVEVNFMGKPQRFHLGFEVLTKDGDEPAT